MLTNEEFEVALTRLDELTSRIKEYYEEIALVLGRCSQPQIKEIKARYSKILGADQIERLVLYGRRDGNDKPFMAKHLAFAERTISAHKFETLPKKDRDTLNNPDAMIPVRTGGTAEPIKYPAVKDMSIFELNQVVDKWKGILPPEKQIPPVKEPELPEDTDEFLSSRVDPKDEECLILIGTEFSKLRVKRKTLLALLAKKTREPLVEVGDAVHVEVRKDSA